ncbi:MAG: FAD-binding protein [Hamadaea sp.]|nr:FAD-binding protein [Hamadaea sp.]
MSEARIRSPSTKRPRSQSIRLRSRSTRGSAWRRRGRTARSRAGDRGGRGRRPRRPGRTRRRRPCPRGAWGRGRCSPRSRGSRGRRVRPDGRGRRRRRSGSRRGRGSSPCWSPGRRSVSSSIPSAGRRRRRRRGRRGRRVSGRVAGSSVEAPWVRIGVAARGDRYPKVTPGRLRCVLTNWAGNVTFGARTVHRPTSLAELRGVVAAASRLRPLGTGHCFNRIADTTGDQVTLAAMPAVMEIDAGRLQVRVSAGVRYGELASHLHSHGYALRNLASLPHISVAGAVATGTHGSGAANGSLATAVRGLDLVTASGDVLELRGERLPGAVVALGALGVVSAVTLEIVPTFDIAQQVYERLPRETDLLEVLRGGYSVSLFTSWSGPTVDQVWRKSLGGAQPGGFFGATPAARPMHPIATEPADACTQQLGVPGPWHERLPHFRLDFTPSSGDELQSEYFVAAGDAGAAFAALDEIRDRIAPVLQICEIRAIAADDLWLSPCQGRDTVAFHFTWKPDAAAVAPVLTAIEERLAAYAVRPHWGKLFSIAPETVAGLYPRFAAFAAFAAELDPQGKFRNDFLDAFL